MNAMPATTDAAILGRKQASETMRSIMEHSGEREVPHFTGKQTERQTDMYTIVTQQFHTKFREGKVEPSRADVERYWAFLT